MLAGNVVGLLSPLLWVPLLTYVLGRPQKYDWSSMKTIGRAAVIKDSGITDTENNIQDPGPADTADEAVQLEKAAKTARWLTISMTLIFLILWPIPMYGSGYVFSRGFFTGWIVVGFIWIFCTILCVGVYPVWESRKTLAHVTKCIARELQGKKVTHSTLAVDGPQSSEAEDEIVPAPEKKG